MPVHYLNCANIDVLADPEPANTTAGLISILRVDIQKQLHCLSALQQLLTAEEKARALRFHQQKDAEQFIVSRAVLKIVLADVTSRKPEEINIVLSENNKPVLSENQEVYFNVSHSNDQAVLAIAQQPVGIDLEEIKEDFDYLSIAAVAFSGAEADYLQHSRNPRRDFFRIWTRKEAFLKGIGTGLIDDLKLISCLDTPTEIHPMITGVKTDWGIKTIEYDPGYIMSIACAGSLPAIRVHITDYQ